MTQGSLTARLTGQAGAKAGHSDPAITCGSVVAQRIKGTLGITAEAGPKGWAVRPLKRYASWVQNVVRQFGPYPPQP